MQGIQIWHATMRDVSSYVCVCVCVCVDHHLDDISLAVFYESLSPRVVERGARRRHRHHLQPQLGHGHRVRVLSQEGVGFPSSVVGPREPDGSELRHYGLKMGY